ncbi:MAG: 3-isopropylmalate dehydrogenase [Clostridiales bacterium]|nr:3-isopropylmalate dehydrogenase [Clostridiales bacterium]
MKEYNIALIKGDGIGPEVVDGAVKVMNTVSEKLGFSLKFTECLAGGCSIDEYGVPLTDETLNICKNSDAVLLGAVGGPKWDDVDASIRPEKALLGLRKELGLYSNLRPALLYEALADACPIKGVTSMDILIVRELTGGIYFGKKGRTDDGAYDTEEYSDFEIRRIVREGFRYAMGRDKRLTVVDKANVLETSRLWREVVKSEAGNFPEVSVEFLYIDNASMQLIGRPQSFDVIVTSNMFGDILSDEAGEITGSVGMLPSASLGDPGKPGMYEPVHGSAPDIAGKGIANPLATILSAAMLFKWSLGEDKASDMINEAVNKVLENGLRTADIFKGEGKLVTTEEMTSAVIESL